MRPAWAEINLSSIKRNISIFRKIMSRQSQIMAVIKADAYGHGAVKIAAILRQMKIKYFGVSLLQEALELRESGFREQIMILGHTPEEDFSLAIKYGLTLTIYDYSQAAALSECARKHGKNSKIHLKIDTGMGRIGFQQDEKAIKDIKRIAKLSNIFIEGVFSHLASANNIKSDFSNIQFNRFAKFVLDLEHAGIKFKFKHIANSAATINFHQMHLDMVRIGISLYGLYPDPQMATSPKIDLYPAMQIKSRLVQVKEMSEGKPISYNCTFKTRYRSIIGTLPMGYADGIPHALSNIGEVLAHGKRCPIVGQVCMDQFMVDLTGLGKISAGEEVVIMGNQGNEMITADDIAEKTGTISYEILTNISMRLPKIYIEDDE